MFYTYLMDSCRLTCLTELKTSTLMPVTGKSRQGTFRQTTVLFALPYTSMGNAWRVFVHFVVGFVAGFDAQSFPMKSIGSKSAIICQK